MDQTEHLRAYVRLAGPQGDPERLANASSTLGRVSPRIPRIVVRVPPNASEGLEIRIGETIIPRQAWGAPRPINPGAVAVEAQGGGYIAYAETLQVREGETIEVDISLVLDPSQQAQVGPDQPEESDDEWMVWAGVGAGVAALGITLALLLSSGGEPTVRNPEFPEGTVVFEALTASPGMTF